jgi:hypothetical protein
MAEVFQLSNGRSVAIAMDWLELPPETSRQRAAVKNHLKTFGARRHIVREGYTGAVLGIIPMSDKLAASHAGALLVADVLSTLDNSVLYLRELVDGRWWCCLAERRLPVAGSDLVLGFQPLLQWLDQLPEVGDVGALQVFVEGDTPSTVLASSLDRFDVSAVRLDDKVGDPELWREAQAKLSALTNGEKAVAAASLVLASALGAGGYIAYQMHLDARAREEAAKVVPPPEVYRRAVAGYLSTQVLVEVGPFSRAAWDELRQLDAVRKGWVLRSASCTLQPSQCKAEYQREPFGIEVPFDGGRLTVVSRSIDKVVLQWPFAPAGKTVIASTADADQLAKAFNTARESTPLGFAEMSNDLALGLKPAPRAEPAQVAGQGQAEWKLEEAGWTIEGSAASLALLSRFPYPAFAESFEVVIDPAKETTYRVAGRVWTIQNPPRGAGVVQQGQKT